MKVFNPNNIGYNVGSQGIWFWLNQGLSTTKKRRCPHHLKWWMDGWILRETPTPKMAGCHLGLVRQVGNSFLGVIGYPYVEGLKLKTFICSWGFGVQRQLISINFWGLLIFNRKKYMVKKLLFHGPKWLSKIKYSLPRYSIRPCKSKTKSPSGGGHQTLRPSKPQWAHPKL